MGDHHHRHWLSDGLSGQSNLGPTLRAGAGVDAVSRREHPAAHGCDDAALCCLGPAYTQRTQHGPCRPHHGGCHHCLISGRCRNELDGHRTNDRRGLSHGPPRHVVPGLRLQCLPLCWPVRGLAVARSTAGTAYARAATSSVGVRSGDRRTRVCAACLPAIPRCSARRSRVGQ